MNRGRYFTFSNHFILLVMEIIMNFNAYAANLLIFINSYYALSVFTVLFGLRIFTYKIIKHSGQGHLKKGNGTQGMNKQ
jgi:hypothetical protein